MLFRSTATIDGDFYAQARTASTGGFPCMSNMTNESIPHQLNNNLGRVALLDTIGQKSLPTAIRWSNTFIPSAETNGYASFDALDIKVWVDPYAKYNELDMNALNVDYLTNAFDDALMTLFSAGYNSASKVYVFDKTTYWQVTRNVTQNATILINKDKGYNITIIQDGQAAIMQNQDDTTNNIFIKQSK